MSGEGGLLNIKINTSTNKQHFFAHAQLQSSQPARRAFLRQRLSIYDVALYGYIRMVSGPLKNTTVRVENSAFSPLID